MTALAANAQRDRLSRDLHLLALPVLATEVIYDGALVAVDADGYAVAAADAAGLRVAGVAHEGFDNATGANGVLGASPARFCRVATGGVYSFVTDGTPLAGVVAYVADDNTISSSSGTNKILAGFFVEPDPLSTSRWYVYVPGLEAWPMAKSAAITALTDSSGGSANNTIAAVGATNSGDVSGVINDNFADLAAKVNAILTHLRASGQVAV